MTPPIKKPSPVPERTDELRKRHLAMLDQASGIQPGEHRHVTVNDREGSVVYNNPTLRSKEA